MEEKKAKEDQGTTGADDFAGADLAVTIPCGEGERLKKIKAPQVPISLPEQIQRSPALAARGKFRLPQGVFP